jgi:hypothetical protein
MNQETEKQEGKNKGYLWGPLQSRLPVTKGTGETVCAPIVLISGFARERLNQGILIGTLSLIPAFLIELSSLIHRFPDLLLFWRLKPHVWPLISDMALRLLNEGTLDDEF